MVSAQKDVRFGDKATLVGATDGVTVRSSEGSIYMGENLTVTSKAVKTLFEAGKDIVIDRDAKLDSQENSVVFSAGENIRFEEDFAVHGKGFELNALGSLLVGDRATVQTKFGKYETGSIESLPQTSIDVKGDVRFGNDATFRTTMLSMNAGDDENHTEGNITFGERASSKLQFSALLLTLKEILLSAPAQTFGPKKIRKIPTSESLHAAKQVLEKTHLLRLERA